jgi:hypothetical protein
MVAVKRVASSLVGLAVVLAVVRCGNESGKPDFAFPDYHPAAHLAPDTYRGLVTSLSKEFSITRLDAFNRLLDRELTGAMAAVFSHASDPQVKVVYGTYGWTQDGVKAFRAIWRYKVPARKIDISVMSFWKYSGGSFRLIGGPDSLRVRSYLGTNAAGDAQFGWLSYEVQVAADGRVLSLSPGVYHRDDGTLKPDIASEASPTRCDGCHYHFSLPSNPESETDLTPEKVWSLRSALADIPETDRARVTESFRHPRQTFMPNGILKALHARFQTFR